MKRPVLMGLAIALVAMIALALFGQTGIDSSVDIGPMRIVKAFAAP
jgi:hypothetical protein